MGRQPFAGAWGVPTLLLSRRLRRRSLQTQFDRPLGVAYFTITMTTGIAGRTTARIGTDYR